MWSVKGIDDLDFDLLSLLQLNFNFDTSWNDKLCDVQLLGIKNESENLVVYKQGTSTLLLIGHRYSSGI